MFVNALTRQLAEDIAYVRWVHSVSTPEAIEKGIIDTKPFFKE